MRPIDYLKALGLAVVVLALNLAITVLLVFLYSQFVAPGHPPEFYNAAAMRIGTWSGPAGGVVLLFLAAWQVGPRRAGRNPLAFGVALGVAYILIDTASGLAMAPVSAFMTPVFLVSMLLALSAATAGGWFAARRR